MDLSHLSLEELRKNLITADYRGMEYKEACLAELISRVKGESNNDRMLQEFLPQQDGEPNCNQH